jgi:integrase
MRSARFIERDMRRVLLKEAGWGPRQVSSLTRRDVKDVIKEMHVKGGHDGTGAPTMANRILTLTKMFDTWALNEELIEHSFTAGIKPLSKNVIRDRFLDEDEVRALWAACDRLEPRPPYGAATKVLLLSGARKEEVAQMTWKEINPDTGRWTLERERTKSDRRHTLTLPPLAISILESVEVLPTIYGRPRRVNPIAEGSIFGGMTGWWKGKLDLDILMAEELKRIKGQDAVLRPWHLHDLRRTCATHMRRIGIDRQTVSKVLNHAEGGVTSVYDHYAMADEVAQALAAWALEVDRLTNPKKRNNVTSFPRVKTA